ncbi:glycosyltransferase [Camelliibacillus cellulosilyticus]|uniref:Glycosyltransferase n=1 Tax=Camelliibacillus cellulosilyticus TaxID=2174486 RepID=A0ABV9GQH0_9BACL
MFMEQCFYVENTLDEDLITQLNQAYLLNKTSLNLVKIVTLNYESNFKNKVSALESQFDISLNNVCLNMYDFLRDFSGLSKPLLPFYSPIEEEGFYCFKATDEDNVYSYFQDGNLKFKKYYTGNIMSLKEYYDQKGEIIKIEEFDIKGYKMRSVNFQLNTPVEEHFYTQDGLCYLSKIKVFNKEEDSPNILINFFDHNAKNVYMYKKIKDLQILFLKFLINSKSTLIISDTSNMLWLEQLLAENNIYIMCRLKTDNLPNTLIKRNELSIPDAIVFPNNVELDLAIKKYGMRNNYFVLPYFLKNSDSGNYVLKNKNTQRIIFNAEQHEMIHMETIIRAFRIVMDRIPTAILTINTSHALEDVYLQLIKELELDKNIEITYKHNHCELYCWAAFSISLSSTEVSIYEVLKSLSCACPVISFDNSNNIHDILLNEQNGYIVKNKSVNNLANKMVFLLERPELLNQMSLKALESVKKYKEEMFMESWDYVISQIVNKKRRRINLTDMTVTMLESHWDKDKSFVIKNEINLTGDVNEYSNPNIYLCLVNRTSERKISIQGEVKIKNLLKVETSNVINFKMLDLSQGKWDVLMCLEWENSYFEKRVGHFRTNWSTEGIKPMIINNRILTPYFTTKGSNLTFKVGKFIPEEDKINKLEARFGIKAES